MTEEEAAVIAKQLAVSSNSLFALKADTDEPNALNSPIFTSALIYDWVYSKYAGNLQLHVDDNGLPRSLAWIPLDKREFSASIIPYASENVQISLEVIPPVVMPGPDYDSFRVRVKREQAERVEKEKEDNRSFFQKYWMYIVPALIFVMMTGGGGEQGGRR